MGGGGVIVASRLAVGMPMSKVATCVATRSGVAEGCAGRGKLHPLRVIKKRMSDMDCHLFFNRISLQQAVIIVIIIKKAKSISFNGL